MATNTKSKASKGKKKEKKIIQSGRVYIQASFNNTIISVTDQTGNVLSWSSSGSMPGFRGAKKATPFAAQLVADAAVKKAIDLYGLKEVDVFINGPGIGRDSAIRSISNAGLKVKVIKDITPVPHNGCRPKKRRRV